MNKECNNCEIGMEAGGCEAAGAKWKVNRWVPTKDCIKQKRILLEAFL